MDQEFEQLKQEFLREASEKLSEIRKLCEGGLPGEEEDFQKVINLAHQLKGSGGSYGYDQMSADAASLEEKLEERCEWNEIEEHLVSIEKTVEVESKTE